MDTTPPVRDAWARGEFEALRDQVVGAMLRVNMATSHLSPSMGEAEHDLAQAERSAAQLLVEAAMRLLYLRDAGPHTHTRLLIEDCLAKIHGHASTIESLHRHHARNTTAEAVPIYEVLEEIGS